VLTADGQPLGRIEGVVIDIPARRLRYFDVQSSGWSRRHYLLEADVQLEPDGNALRLRCDLNVEEAEEFDAAALSEYSEEHLLALLFPSRAA
jgi:hypothetical protein